MSRPLFLAAKPLQAERQPTLGWNNISPRETHSACVALAKNESVTTRPPGSELHDQANLWGLLFDEKFCGRKPIIVAAYGDAIFPNATSLRLVNLGIAL